MIRLIKLLRRYYMIVFSDVKTKVIRTDVHWPSLLYLASVCFGSSVSRCLMCIHTELGKFSGVAINDCQKFMSVKKFLTQVPFFVNTNTNRFTVQIGELIK